MHVALAVSARALTMFVLAGLVAGCASPYSPKGLTGGYTQREVNPNTFTVTFDGNGYASKELVLNYWVNRCAELTISHGYQYFALLPAARTSGGVEPDEDLLPNERFGRLAIPARGSLEGNSAGWDFVPVRSAPTYIYVPSYSVGHTVSTWHKTGTIEMYHSRIGFTTTQRYALHAQTLLDLLKPFVQSAGKSPVPSLQELLDAAARIMVLPPGKP